MEQYIRVAKDLLDHIMTAGDVLNDREQMLYLDSNYTSLITNITSRKCVIPLDDIFT